MRRNLIPFFAAVLFLIIGIGWDVYNRRSFNDRSLSIRISENIDRELESLENEAAYVTNDGLSLNWSSLKHSFYLFDSGRIVAWSKNDFSVGTPDLAGDFKLKLLQTQRMDLMLYRFPIGSKSLVGIIPLRTGYEIVNRYLTTSWNNRIFPLQGGRIFSVGDSRGVEVCSINHGCLFKVQFPADAFIRNVPSLVFVSLGILTALLGLFYIVRDAHRQQRYLRAFIFLFGSLAVTRIAMVQLLVPGRWVYSEFFDPKYFASSSFNASVGDLFLNALIVSIACGYLFLTYTKLHFVKASLKKSNKAKWLISTLLLSASFFVFLFPHLFVESIFHDSSISIDLSSNVEFDGLRIVAFIALILGCVSSFFFAHILVRWSKSLVKSGWHFILCIAAAGLLFVGYFLSSDLDYWVTLFVGAVYFTMMYYSRYFKSIAKIEYRTFSYLLIVIIAFGLQGALGIWRFYEEKEVRSMFRSARNLINRDVLGEYLLNEATRKIAKDKFIISNMASPLLAKDAVRQKIKQVHLNSYFDRYDVKVKLYYADGTPADRGVDDFATSIKALQSEANKTTYEGVYLIRNTSPETVKRYLSVTPLIRNTSNFGFAVLDLSLMNIIPQQVYPELLVDNRFSQALRNSNYSYAFFNKGELMSTVGSFNFDRDFDRGLLGNQSLYSGGIVIDGNLLVGVEDDTGRHAVVSSEAYPIFSVVANFSFLFTLGIGVLSLFLAGSLISQTRQKVILNYSTRIQLYIYLSFIIPLVVVSTIAVRMISQSDDAQLEREVRGKGIQITETFSDLLTGKDTSDNLHDLQTKVTEIAQASAVDANVYAPSGALLVSSQPTIFTSQLVMPLVRRDAWEKIVKEKFNIVQSRSNIGALEYNSLFFAIKSSGRSHFEGILELPFLKSNSELAKVSVLTNIVVTFAAVFICFSFFAFSFIHKLTSPLRLIAKKLKTTSLANNQPIAWHATDEIGLMVKEYNRMLENLEQNKKDLARSQKESAWREIAQQVAHEIKNPLTPMKLTLQQLEQSVALGPIDRERTKKALETILTQLETLNDIAGSFSAFASMPPPAVVKLDIIILLKEAEALFQNHANALVKLDGQSKPIFVKGDTQLLRRIFANIILNAIQSVEGGKRPQVIIDIKEEGEWCVASFKDNGQGVVQDLRDKIFQPHFSTKSTGSGLGLAIAKQGIEQMGGSIWLQSSEGNGTTFFVKLRLSSSAM